MSRDIDNQAQCGIWQCVDCEQIFYPMELISGMDLDPEDIEHDNLCPACMGNCERIRPCM